MTVSDPLLGVFLPLLAVFFIVHYHRSIDLLSSVFVIAYPLVQCLLKLGRCSGALMFESHVLTDQEIRKGLRISERTGDLGLIGCEVELEFFSYPLRWIRLQSSLVVCGLPFVPQEYLLFLLDSECLPGTYHADKVSVL